MCWLPELLVIASCIAPWDFVVVEMETYLSLEN